MKHLYCANNEIIKIRPLMEKDIEYLRCWRNDPELSTYLNEIPFITPEKQLDWFNSYLTDNDNLFFVIVDKKRDIQIGSVALYKFRGNSCEVGRIVIGDSASHGKGMGYNALLLVITIAIQKFNVNFIKLDVHEANLPARNIYEKIGFQIIGKHEFQKGGYELEMEISAEDFIKQNPIIKNIKVYEMTRYE